MDVSAISTVGKQEPGKQIENHTRYNDLKLIVPFLDFQINKAPAAKCCRGEMELFLRPPGDFVITVKKLFESCDVGHE